MEYVRLQSESPTIGKASNRIEYVFCTHTVWLVVGASKFRAAIAPSDYNCITIIEVE